MLTRHVGERIVIDQGIEVIVHKISRSTVKLGVRVPKGVLVLRGEVWDAVARENRAAAEIEFDEDAIVNAAIQVTPESENEP